MGNGHESSSEPASAQVSPPTLAAPAIPCKQYRCLPHAVFPKQVVQMSERYILT